MTDTQTQGEFRRDLAELHRLADTILDAEPDPALVRTWLDDLADAARRRP